MEYLYKNQYKSFDPSSVSLHKSTLCGEIWLEEELGHWITCNGWMNKNDTWVRKNHRQTFQRHQTGRSERVKKCNMLACCSRADRCN